MLREARVLSRRERTTCILRAECEGKLKHRKLCASSRLVCVRMSRRCKRGFAPRCENKSPHRPQVAFEGCSIGFDAQVISRSGNDGAITLEYHSKYEICSPEQHRREMQATSLLVAYAWAHILRRSGESDSHRKAHEKDRRVRCTMQKSASHLY